MRNRVRLPIELTRPQYVEEFSKYRLANGKTKTQSVVIRKVYNGNTDWLPELLHERLKIALAHDLVYIEGEKYFGQITQEGNYNIKWPEQNNYPTAPGEFKAEVSGLNLTNSNCMTCEEAIQVLAVDDNVGTRAQGSTITYDVSANDNICCYPVSFSIRYYDDSVVASAVISLAGVVTIVLKTPIQSYTNLKLATYRAECAAGQYDDADIFANITGSLTSCAAPTAVGAYFITSGGALMVWTPPTGYSGVYHYQLFDSNNLGAAVREGDVSAAQIEFNDLTPNTNYTFYVYAACAPGVNSNQISKDFQTISTTTGGPNTGNPNCGQYRVVYENPYEFGDIAQLTYRNCVNEIINTPLLNGIPYYFCALETTPGAYFVIFVNKSPMFVNLIYVTPC